MAFINRRSDAGNVSISGADATNNSTLVVAIADLGNNTGALVVAGVGPGAGGVERTAGMVAAVADGSVTAGKRSVSFSSSSDFVGTIASATFGASQAVGFTADGNDTIGAIAYTVSDGTLYIATLT